MAEIEEVWRPIPWANGRYLVSDLGRVKTLVTGSGGRPGIIMRQHPTCRYGHLKVCIHASPKDKRQKLVHALVMEAFVGPRPPGLMIDHIDFDPTNNRLANLRYVTPAENCRHSARAGRMQGNGYKLDPDSVRAIREASGTQREIAARFGVTQGMVSMIRLRKVWAHV